MAISSVSLTYFSMVSTPSASAPVGNVAPAASDSTVAKKASCDDHEPRRRNVLFDAMMSALRELGLTKPATPGGGSTAGATSTSATAASGTSAGAGAGAASPAPAATETAPAATSAATPASTTPAPSLEDAVLSFAHALWQALRGDEGSRQRRGGDDDHRHHHHHHHHHHGHGRSHGRDYSGLASRIEALAVRIDAAAPGNAPATLPPAGTTPRLPGIDPVPMDAAAPGVATTPATEAAPTPGATPAAPAAAAAPGKGSLAESFAAMLKLLRGGDQPAGAPAPDTSLATFLHSLARGLDVDRSAPSTTVVGVMINVTA